MRVAYVGKNRNKSYISKETFEKCIDTIYNCPIVCNYNRETNSIGAHDVDIVKTDNGVQLVNITQPIGIVPESAKIWFETIEEDNGETHEYLCAEVLIWKRQEAYQKIKENGITDESMEINVKSGKTIDGFYHIDSFEFTAFCLLESAEPCYESACVEMFSLSSFRREYTKMMVDFKNSFLNINTSTEDDINQKNLLKGGNSSLDKMKLLSEYGLTVESLDFNIDDFTIEELKAKFEEIKDKGSDNGEDPEDKTEVQETKDDGTDDNQVNTGEDTYSLTGQQFLSELTESLSQETYSDPYWGDIPKYMYVDHDTDISEVYCYDLEDGKLYGFKYTMNGDNVVIDFVCKKRKKCSFVDFDEGSVDFDYKYGFENFKKSIKELKDAELSNVKAKYSQTIEVLQNELCELKKYKKSKLDEERKNSEDKLFAKFSELNGIEAFEQLRNNCSKLTIEEIENKCFEIKGRNYCSLEFSTSKPSGTRMIIDKNNHEDEPYGGLFIEFPPEK